MSRLMIDTSAWSGFRRGVPEIVEAIRTTPRLLFPIIAMGELLAGFEAGGLRESNRAALAEFLSSPRVRIQTVGETTASRYAVIYASLKRAGHPIPTNDMWIAALAMQHGAELLTMDDHFTHVPQIITRLIEV